MPSRSNSALVAWLTCLGSGFRPLRTRDCLGLVCVVFMHRQPAGAEHSSVNQPRRKRAGIGLARSACALAAAFSGRQRATRVGKSKSVFASSAPVVPPSIGLRFRNGSAKWLPACRRCRRRRNPVSRSRNNPVPLKAPDNSSFQPAIPGSVPHSVCRAHSAHLPCARWRQTRLSSESQQRPRGAVALPADAVAQGRSRAQGPRHRSPFCWFWPARQSRWPDPTR